MSRGERHRLFAGPRSCLSGGRRCLLTWGGWSAGRLSGGRHPALRGGPPRFLKNRLLVLLLTDLLAVAFASKRFFYTLFLAGLQVERMTLYFLDDVFRLNLPLEPSQCVFERLAFLHSNFCQGNTPPNRPKWAAFRISHNRRFATDFWTILRRQNPICRL
jgi:hypothetical protein